MRSTKRLHTQTHTHTHTHTEKQTQTQRQMQWDMVEREGEMAGEEGKGEVREGVRSVSQPSSRVLTC